MKILKVVITVASVLGFSLAAEEFVIKADHVPSDASVLKIDNSDKSIDQINMAPKDNIFVPTSETYIQPSTVPPVVKDNTFKVPRPEMRGKPFVIAPAPLSDLPKNDFEETSSSLKSPAPEVLHVKDISFKVPAERSDSGEHPTAAGQSSIDARSTAKTPSAEVLHVKDNTFKVPEAQRIDTSVVNKRYQERNEKEGGDSVPSAKKVVSDDSPIVAKDITYHLRTEDGDADKKPGFFTKAFQSVVDTVIGYNRDEEEISEKPPKQVLANNDANMKLIEVLEKHVALLKETGQTEKLKEATEDLLHAYADMAASLKALKYRKID